MIFDDLVEQKYFGEFQCDSSESIHAYVNSIPDASQFLPSDQISKIEQLAASGQYQPENSAEGIQVTDTVGFSPVSENAGGLQNLDSDPSSFWDEIVSPSQVYDDVSLYTTENPVDNQDYPVDEGLGYDLFSDPDFLA